MSYPFTLDQVLIKLRELSIIIIKEHLVYSLLSDFIEVLVVFKDVAFRRGMFQVGIL